MNTKNKKALLIGIIILLLVINISALSTIYYKSKIIPKRNIELNNMKEEVRIQGMHRFIKEQLNLSDTQFSEFKEVSRTNMIKSQEISFKLDKKRIEMINEIAKLNPNPASLDRIAHEIGVLHYELKMITINHFLELKEICTDDQQANLQRLFTKMVQEQDMGQNRTERGHGEKNRNRTKRSQRKTN